MIIYTRQNNIGTFGRDSNLRVMYTYKYVCLLISSKHVYFTCSSVMLLTYTRETKTRANVNTMLHNPSICILYIIYTRDTLISRGITFIKGDEKYFYFVSSVIFPPHDLRNKTCTQQYIPNAYSFFFSLVPVV